jgi:hypothetical protein
MQIFFDDEEELAIEVSEANAASSGSRYPHLSSLFFWMHATTRI